MIRKHKFQDLSAVEDKEHYDKWLEKLVSSLQKSWNKKREEELDIGRAYKVVNLLLKRVSRELRLGQQKKVVKWLRVPLDKFTLAAIREVITLPDGKRIPANAAMGFINNTRRYKHIQQCVNELAKKAGVPPIALDYIAYNDH